MRSSAKSSSSSSSSSSSILSRLPSLLLLILSSITFTSPTLAALISTSSSTSSTATSLSLQQPSADLCVSRYRPPNIRYPPVPLASSSSSSSSSTKNNNNNNTKPATWTPPPESHLWSPYHFTYSTRPRYLNLTNMQATHYPVFPTNPDFPPGSQIDIITWSTDPDDVTSDLVTTVFGYFRPLVIDNGTTAVVATWNYSSTGPLIGTSNLWAILGWGVDSDGVEYRVDYEGGYEVEGGDAGDVLPCINVASRVLGGPSERTYKEIVDGLRDAGRERGDDAFVELVGGLKRMKSDRRGKGSGMADIECDEACVMNTDLVPARMRRR